VSKIDNQNQTLMHSGIIRGIMWILAMTAVSNLNDVLMKFLGQRLPSVEVAFFRFFFGIISMLPVMVYLGKKSLGVNNWHVHALRTILGTIAIMIWCYGVTHVHLTIATTLGFTVPLFVLPLAMIFLKEHVGIRRWIITLIGFSGILIVINPLGTTFNTAAAFLLLSSVCFALSDIIGKKMITNESMATILFYFSIGASIISLPFAINVWQSPNMNELGLLLLLGVGCNLIQFCVLKAFQAADVSVLSPFRYVELLFAATTGWLFFGESIHLSTGLGAAIIIPSTLYLAHYELKLRKKA
jgi:S-adenosylmethionine uptake transporter